MHLFDFFFLFLLLLKYFVTTFCCPLLKTSVILHLALILSLRRALSGNQLVGPLPKVLRNSTTLLRLYLSSNRFSGQLGLFASVRASAPSPLECTLQSLSVQGNAGIEVCVKVKQKSRDDLRIDVFGSVLFHGPSSREGTDWTALFRRAYRAVMMQEEATASANRTNARRSHCFGRSIDAANDKFFIQLYQLPQVLAQRRGRAHRLCVSVGEVNNTIEGLAGESQISISLWHFKRLNIVLNKNILIQTEINEFTETLFFV